MKHSLLATFLLGAAAILSSTTTTRAQEPPKPGAEHQRLLACVGNWNCALEMMGPDGKPAMSKGTTVLKAGPGGLWLIEDFTGEMMGAPFFGHGVIGYDPAKAKYVMTWVDSYSASAMSLEGTYDQKTKAMTLTGMGPGMDGKPVMHRMVTTDKDANTRVFEMFAPGPDGKEMKMLTITYTRAATGDVKK
jgi:hypothetical protein